LAVGAKECGLTSTELDFDVSVQSLAHSLIQRAFYLFQQCILCHLLSLTLSFCRLHWLAASYLGAERRADGPELAENGFWITAALSSLYVSLFDSLSECSLFFLRHCVFPLVLMFEVERSQARTSSRLKRRYFPGRKQGKGLRDRARVFA
jgi:hypothetical protein